MLPGLDSRKDGGKRRVVPVAELLPLDIFLQKNTHSPRHEAA
jgi:hypothetical protein